LGRENNKNVKKGSKKFFFSARWGGGGMGY